MKVIGSIDGSSKTNPCEVRPNKHRCSGEVCIGEVCIDERKDNHQGNHYKREEITFGIKDIRPS